MQLKDRYQILLILLLTVVAFCSLSWRYDYHTFKDTLKELLIPARLSTFQLEMRVDAQEEMVRIQTWLPASSTEQQIIHEQIDAPEFALSESSTESGRRAVWEGTVSQASIVYRAELVIQETKFLIDEDLPLVPADKRLFGRYLAATKDIQVFHPEIKHLWQQIKPKQSDRVLPVLKAIYRFTTHELEGVPFKGTTDALTALRLRQASCNGKSRLFVALARLKGIPARLVGGVILNGERKKTSHQWVEVNIDGHWVPFGPTNHHFASKPANYLKLYYGDEVLFTRTSDIFFDYAFNTGSRLVSSAIYHAMTQQISAGEEDSEGKKRDEFNLVVLLFKAGMNESTSALFLLFPLCTLLLGFLRNVAGLKTFGVFLPMLVAGACTFTGLINGIFIFLGILGLSFFVHAILSPLNLLKVARLAAVITINTLVFIFILYRFNEISHFKFAMLSLFPVVIISFVAERVHRLTQEHDWQSIVLIALGTLVAIAACYWVLNSFVLISMFAYFPELFLLVVAAQLFVGRWVGIRLTELIRFRRLLKKNKHQVMGINSRNLEFVNLLNSDSNLLLAADKLKAKERLAVHQISIIETLATFSDYDQLTNLKRVLSGVSAFALKPNFGSQGNGIVIFTKRKGDDFIAADGRAWSMEAIRQHCITIINGQFSQAGDRDIAFIEPLIRQEDSLNQLSPFGLADIRVILMKSRPVSAMLRIPTRRSNGKANLHQGAVGVAVNITSGETFHAAQKGRYVETHPDTGENLIGFKISEWERILELCQGASEAIPLGFMGVDICIDQQLGPLILEVNGRPGIEIQNVQDHGLYWELKRGLST